MYSDSEARPELEANARQHYIYTIPYIIYFRPMNAHVCILYSMSIIHGP